MKEVVFDIKTPKVDFDVGTIPQLEFDVGEAVLTVGGIPYTGPCEVTPCSEEVVLETSDKVMTSNIVVKPIPNNYGLITYNGYDITVS